MLIVDSTSNYDESYSIFNFVWEIICYMWEQTLETNSVKLGNGVIIGPLWVKYGGKIVCQSPSVENPGNAPAWWPILVTFDFHVDLCDFDDLL